jgi:tripartite-type tricarboxylate transporter receptor subunit TctC
MVHMMTISRRRLLHIAAGTTLGSSFARTGWADAYPARPVRIIVGSAAGGTADVIARLMGEWLSRRLAQSVIIENRPGAATNVGTELVVRAAPDGYTLLFATGTNAINATLYDKLSFNFIRDVTPVAAITRNPFVLLIHPSIPAKTGPELIAYAKANPGKLAMASAGIGTPHHVFGELFDRMAGIEMLHVPYRGEAPALTDLVAGQVQVMFITAGPVIEYYRSGTLRALAVTTAARLPSLSEVPSIGEFVPGYEASGWFGIAAPKNTPADIVMKLNNEINSALAEPAMKTRLAGLALSGFPVSPAEFEDFIVADTKKWAEVIRAANISAD